MSDETTTLQDGNAAGDKSGKVFTQEQVDTILQDRLGRKEKSTIEALLLSLGAKDLEEAKALIAAQKQAAIDKQTAEELLNAKIKDAEDRAAKAEQADRDHVAEMEKRILDSELKIEAARVVMGKTKVDGKEVDATIRPAFKPEALDDVLLLVDRSKIAYKDGKYEGVAEALDNLAKAKPYLLTEDPKPAGKGSPGAGKTTKTGEEGKAVGVKPQHYTL
jgi:hypothetical protein